MFRHPLLAFLLSLLAGGLVVGACASDPPPKPPPPPKCPKVKRATDEVVEEVLCAQKDSDGDGVDDAVDLCEGAQEVNNGEADGDGCPDPDRDQDLIIDFDDACPDKAGAPPDGCPVADADGDGLADHLDGCPTRAEDLDGEDDADGCPEGDRRLQPGEALVVWQEIAIPQRRGKPEATVEGVRAEAALLERIAERVGVVVRVEIRGSAGLKEVRRKRAQRLADARAEAMRTLIARTGVPPSRLDVSAEVLMDDRSGDTGEVVVRVETAAPANKASADGGVMDPAPSDAGPGAAPF